MLEKDEFDQYNDSLDVENDFYVSYAAHSSATDAPPDSNSSSQSTGSIPPQEELVCSPQSAHSEFSDFDLSEFTAADFAAIDASALAALASTITPPAEPPNHNWDVEFTGHSAPTRQSARLDAPPVDSTGGPAVQIVIERPTDTRAVLKASTGQKPENIPSEPGPSRPANGSNGNGHRRSPYDEFRMWRGRLAVTDLTGPSWCEVQFDYGLRQRRDRKLTERPTSFVTADGKTISVDGSVAAVNDQIQTKGKVVHKALEREVHPEERIVEATTPLEQWGLRLVNMIVAVQSIMEQDRCREMPVFGILHDVLVTGIIDAIDRQTVLVAPTSSASSPRSSLKRSISTPSSSQKSKKARQALPPSQRTLDSFFPVWPPPHEPDGSGFVLESTPSSANSSSVEDPIPSSSTESSTTDVILRPSIQLHISDTKTRNSPGLPPEEDTLAARLQLMLYHRLLSDVLTPGALDFNVIWKRVRVSPREYFSGTFAEQAGLADLDPSNDTWCLEDLERVWRNVVEAMHVEGVDPEMTIEYRSQRRWKGGGSRSPRKEKGKERAGERDEDRAPTPKTSVETSTQLEEKEVVNALLTTLESSPPPSQLTEDEGGTAPVHVVHAQAEPSSSTTPPGVPTENGVASTSAESVSSPPETGDPELQQAIYQSLGTNFTAVDASAEKTPRASDNDASTEGSETETDQPADERWRVVGTKTFFYDEQFLDDYLTSVMQYWRGERLPRGVNVMLTRRCRTCEYRDGCEWREQKAQELADLHSWKRELNV